MRYKLRENVEVNFNNVKKYEVANRIGINKSTLSNILSRKATTDKATAFYIVHLNGGREKDINKYFETLERK